MKMKKNYIKPISKCVDLGLENMIAESDGILKAGRGSGDNDASSKERGFFDDESDDIDW